MAGNQNKQKVYNYKWWKSLCNKRPKRSRNSKNKILWPTTSAPHVRIQTAPEVPVINLQHCCMHWPLIDCVHGGGGLFHSQKLISQSALWISFCVHARHANFVHEVLNNFGRYSGTRKQNKMTFCGVFAIYCVFFFLFGIFLVSLCTCALVLDVCIVSLFVGPIINKGLGSFLLTVQDLVQRDML